jgi:hypothetical protein
MNFIDLKTILHADCTFKASKNSVPRDISGGPHQRHLLRDRRPSKAACPVCGAIETRKLKKCSVRKTIFCTGPTRAAKARKKIFCIGRRSLRNQPRKNPLHLHSLSPQFHLSFNSQQGPPLSSLSGPLFQNLNNFRQQV